MAFAARIVVRKSHRDGRAYAGFASKVPAGEVLKSFGSWYGSQMRYLPFTHALADARAFADSYNSAAEQTQAKEPKL
jgi:hypothetical protein